MLSLKPVLFLLLTVVCLGVSKVTPHQKQQLSTGCLSLYCCGVVAVVDGGHGVFPVRIAYETGSNGEEDSSSMILAEKRTRRKDPANHLKYYNGGWNISDHHYKSVSCLLWECILPTSNHRVQTSRAGARLGSSSFNESSSSG
ncbi:putative transmembrane protein [Helianthus anomalus]